MCSFALPPKGSFVGKVNQTKRWERLHRWTSPIGVSFFLSFFFFLFLFLFFFEIKKPFSRNDITTTFSFPKNYRAYRKQQVNRFRSEIVGSMTLKCSHFQVWFSAATRILHGCPFRHHYLGSAPLYVTFSTRVSAKEARFPSTETKGRNLRSLNGVQTVSLSLSFEWPLDTASRLPRVCPSSTDQMQT